MALKQTSLSGMGNHAGKQSGQVYLRPGSRFWQLKYIDRDGREVRRSSRTEIKEEAEAILLRLLNPRLSFKRASVLFFERTKLADRTREGYLRSLKVWDPRVGHLDCCDIRKEHIIEFVNESEEAGLGSPAIRQHLAFLSSLLSFASTLNDGPDVNVVKGYSKKHLPLPNERTRFLRLSEAQRLLKCFPTFVKFAIVQCVLEIGLRRTEVLPLRWTQINFQDRYILIRGKGGKERLVPISDTLLCTLLFLPAHTEYVFPNPDTLKPYFGPEPWFQAALSMAGIEDFLFHDLRHTFASWWTQRGGSDRALSKVLGHGSTAITRRYQHLGLAGLVKEMRRINAQFEHSLA